MMRKSISRTIRITAAVSLSLWMAVTISPSGPTATASHDQVSITLRILATDYYKGDYGSQRASGSSGSTQAVGETGFAALGVGFFDDQGRDKGNLCMNGTGNREFDAPHVWRATYEVLPAELGKVALEIDWSHVYARVRGQEEQVAGDTRRITMAEGETHILDFVDVVPDQGEYCARNVSIAVTAKIAEDPETMYEALEYDLWLRHTDSVGNVHDRRFRTIGSQGKLIEFRMLPLRFLAAESFYPHGAGIDSILEILGAVRGRLRADGLIDVRLSVTRWIDAEMQGEPRRGGIGDGGNKTFSVAPGETVSMVLPAPRGSNCITLQSATSGTGIDLTPKANKHCVDSAEYYDDHQDEIILTVNRVR